MVEVSFIIITNHSLTIPIVGVTGSGKPMTEQKSVRDKHVFVPTLEDQ